MRLASGQKWLASFYSELEYNPDAANGRTGGTRLKLEYPRGIVDRVKWPNEQAMPNFIGRHPDGDKKLFSGSVRSGGDWAFLSDTYILSFDSRVTLQLALEKDDFNALLTAREEDRKSRNREIASGPDGLLVEMTLRGMANVSPKRLLQGREKCWIPLTMSARFEGPTGKIAHASHEERLRAEFFQKQFMILTQYQFHAPGRLRVPLPTSEDSKNRLLRPDAILLSFFYDDSSGYAEAFPAEQALSVSKIGS